MRALAPPSGGERPDQTESAAGGAYGKPLKKSYIDFMAKQGMPCSVLL
jgi:hypothetical protein